MEHKLSEKKIITIPNMLSMFRLLLIPVIAGLFFTKKSNIWITAIVVLSAVTDVIDGKIARRFSMTSDLGKILDPVADKLTQAVLIFCLASKYSWLWGVIILFGIKEGLMIYWGYLELKRTSSVNSAKWYGKLSTVILYAVIILLFLFPDLSEITVLSMIIICGAVILFSLVMYARFYREMLTEEILGENQDKILMLTWKIAVGVLWVAIIILMLLHKGDLTVSEILEYAPSNRILAAFVILGLFALKSVSIVLYSGILYAANGVLFPLPAAILLNIIGTVIMVSIPYFIGKKTGASTVERITEKYPRAGELKALRQKNDFFFSYIVRLIKVPPSDIVSLYMGAVSVHYGKYLSGCVLGFLPACITFPVMGMSIIDIHSPLFYTALGVELLFYGRFIYMVLYLQEK